MSEWRESSPESKECRYVELFPDDTAQFYFSDGNIAMRRVPIKRESVVAIWPKVLPCKPI
jgi:hypothetical protein